MNEPEWALSKVEQKVSGGGSAIGRDLHSDHSGAGSGQRNVQETNLRFGGEIGSYVEAMDQHFRRHQEERSILERRVDELQDIVANREDRLRRAQNDYSATKSKVTTLSAQVYEQAGAIDELHRLERLRHWAPRIGSALGGLLLVGGILLGVGLAGPDEPAQTSTVPRAVPLNPGQNVSKASIVNDQRAVIDVVTLYFSHIRLHELDNLIDFQSSTFRKDNPPRDVSEFWAKNDSGLWARPTVVSENTDALWVRVPFISGRGSAQTYGYVYWSVLRANLVIDKSAKGGTCTGPDESSCSKASPPS